MLDGAVQGAEAVRLVVLTIRSLYDRREHKFAGPYSSNGFPRTTSLRSTASLLAVSSSSPITPRGQTQHVVASYRPRSSLLSFPLAG